MKRLFLSMMSMAMTLMAIAADYTEIKDISYVPQGTTDAYRLERCKLDVYYPTDVKEFATVVWFHGGGLEGGNKGIPTDLRGQGFAVVAVNYRLSPRAKNPAYIDDAAAAVAWVMQHIAEYGGSTSKIFVSGHSAGGYLSLILATDKRYMAAYGADADSVAAYLPVSGQTVTHFTIRKERGLPNGIPVIDEYAPVNRTRPDTAPIIMITGDRRLEMADRWEENALMESVSRNIGNKRVKLYELQGFDHGTVVDPACKLIRNYVREHSK